MRQQTQQPQSSSVLDHLQWAWLQRAREAYAKSQDEQTFNPVSQRIVDGRIVQVLPPGYTPGTPYNADAERGAAIDLLSGMAPVVGDARDIAETTTGYDQFTGQKLSASDRIATGVSSFLPLVGGSLMSKLTKMLIGGSVPQNAAKLQRILDDIGAQYETTGSRLSSSTYFDIVKPDGGKLKIRVSNHDLPPSYSVMHGNADIEVGPHMQGAESWNDVIDYLVKHNVAKNDQGRNILEMMSARSENAQKAAKTRSSNVASRESEMIASLEDVLRAQNSTSPANVRKIFTEQFGDGIPEAQRKRISSQATSNINAERSREKTQQIIQKNLNAISGNGADIYQAGLVEIGNHADAQSFVKWAKSADWDKARQILLKARKNKNQGVYYMSVTGNDPDGIFRGVPISAIEAMAEAVRLKGGT